jgi:hypothetical protein
VKARKSTVVPTAGKDYAYDPDSFAMRGGSRASKCLALAGQPEHAVSWGQRTEHAGRVCGVWSAAACDVHGGSAQGWCGTLLYSGRLVAYARVPCSSAGRGTYGRRAGNACEDPRPRSKVFASAGVAATLRRDYVSEPTLDTGIEHFNRVSCAETFGESSLRTSASDIWVCPVKSSRNLLKWI